MQWLSPVLLAIQVISSLGIILLVLLQQGKGADMGSSFGGGSAGSLFGATGAANFLSRATKWAAVIFFAATIGLAYVSHKPTATAVDGGLMQGYEQRTVPSVPSVPGSTGVPGNSANTVPSVPVVPSTTNPSTVPSAAPDAAPGASSDAADGSAASDAPADAPVDGAAAPETSEDGAASTSDAPSSPN